MSDLTPPSVCGTGSFLVTLNVKSKLPGTTGQPVYAAGSVNAVGGTAAKPGKPGYLEWSDYSAGTKSYPVLIKDPSSMQSVSASIASIPTSPVQTAIAVSQPAMARTTMAKTYSGSPISVEVKDASHIQKQMNAFGGMKGAGDGFGGAIVQSILGNTVNLNKDVITNTISEGATATFYMPFTKGVDTIQVADVSGIEVGMIPSGGGPNGQNAFSATTSVIKIDSATKELSLSDKTVLAIWAGETVTFKPGQVSVIVLDDTSAVAAGMSVRGGAASPAGNSFNPDTFVTHVDATKKAITLSEPVSVNNIAINRKVTFVPPIPSQIIGYIGTDSTVALCIPNDQLLGGGRIIFTLGKKGNFPFNSANSPIAPVPYKGTVTNNYYDFIEFAWTPSIKNLNYDTSIVDQFGFPITIEFSSDPSGIRGIELSRDKVISAYQSWMPSTITANLGAQNQIIAFFSTLSTVMTPYRIMAPADAFLLSEQSNASPDFVQTVNSMNTYFDAVIKTFFDTYDQSLHKGAKFTMVNVPGADNTGKMGSNLHDLSGIVTKVTVNNTKEQAPSVPYRVLQLTDVTPGITTADGQGWVYEIYEPFFGSNGYDSGVYAALPPYWLNTGKDPFGTLKPIMASPTEMVFGASGVFADSNVAGTAHPTPGGADVTKYQILLGAIENQMVTAISRGILLAPQWRWLYEAPNNSGKGLEPQVTVNPGNTLTIPSTAFVPVYVGMAITEINTNSGLGVPTDGKPNTVTKVDFDNTGSSTITLRIANTVSTQKESVQVLFSYTGIDNPFYQKSDPMSIAPFNGESFNNSGVWNYFAQFFHQPYDAVKGTGISIGGLAYAYAFDDQGNFSTDISINDPANAIVNIGTDS